MGTDSLEAVTAFGDPWNA